MFKKEKMTTCVKSEYPNIFDFCNHPQIENGYCEICGENIHVFQIELGNSNEKANLEDYRIIIESIESIPPIIKAKLLDTFSRESSLSTNMRSFLNHVYRLTIEFAKELRKEDKDGYGFIETQFNIEMCKISNKKFGRKNINQINKSIINNDTNICISVETPLEYVKPVCIKNKCPELIQDLKNVFRSILECDVDKNIYEIIPELAVMAMISIYNDRYGFLNFTQNSFAKNNSISPSSLKSAKISLKEIMEHCSINIESHYSF